MDKMPPKSKILTLQPGTLGHVNHRTGRTPYIDSTRGGSGGGGLVGVRHTGRCRGLPGYFDGGLQRDTLLRHTNDGVGPGLILTDGALL